MEKKLKDSLFTDIYIGEAYTEVKGLFGASILLAPAPDNLLEDIGKLKFECKQKYENTGRTEFSIKYDGVFYRVTVSQSNIGSVNYVIRQTHSDIISINDIGLPPFFIEIITRKETVGLILIAGKMGVGKTTTAASIITHRTSVIGGVSVALEDPIETLLDGRHGKGRCFQVEIGEHEGYSSALKKAMRMGASHLFIGEIRDSDTAHEALKASINGMFVIATIHANGIIDAIERFDILCSEKNINSKAIVSRSLCAVVSQTMDYVERNGSLVARNVNISAFHLQDDLVKQKTRNKIANGDFSQLIDEIKIANQQRNNSARGGV